MIVNIYKSRDWTSFDVVAKIRSSLKLKKVGHAGTLDPLAEGVLIILTGDDTKKQDRLMGSDKEYVAKIVFGAHSPTFDLEFKPELKTVPKNEDFIKDVERVLPQFIGEYEQVIPAYSAKKIEGKEMYKYARKGLETPRQTKKVHVYSLEIMESGVENIDTTAGAVTLPYIVVKMKCSPGTYVRSFAHEIGEKLETGAVLASLIRTKVGNYEIKDSIKIEDFLSQHSV